MPKKNTFVTQALILAAASLLVRFIGFLYRLPLTGLIGDEGNAYYAAGYTIYTFVLILSSAGLPAAISKLVAERAELKQYRNAHEVFKVSMTVALALGGAGALFLAVSAGWLAGATGYPEAVYAIRTLAPTVLIVSVMSVYRGYFQGMKNTVPTALSQVLEQVFNAVFSVLLAYLLFNEAHIEYAAAGGTAGTGIGAVAGLLALAGVYLLAAPNIRRRVRQDYDKTKYEPRKKLAVDVIKTALPIIIGTAVFSIAAIVDMSMVSNRLTASGAFSPEEIRVLYGQLSGKYVLLTTLPVSLSTALATAAIPSIAGSQALMDKNAVKGKLNMALRLSMVITIPAAVGLGVLGGPLLKMLFPSHPDGELLLQVGVLSVILLALVQIVTGMLQGIGRVNVPVYGALLGVALKIPLNYALIAVPEINVTGAVISTTACYAAAAGVNIYFLYRYTRLRFDIAGVFIKPLIASAVMGLACYVIYHLLYSFTQSNAFSALAAILAGVAAYGGFMLLIKGFMKDDIAALPLGDRLVRMLRF